MKRTIGRKSILTAFACLVILLSLVMALPASAVNQTINLSGSTTVQPIAESSVTPYYNASGNHVNVSSGGSGVGAANILNDTSDIGMMSCPLTDKMTADQAATVIDWKIARDMVCIVVNKNLGVADITKAQIKAIFEAGTSIGALKWSDIAPGTPSSGDWSAITQYVVPVSRDTTSGTRSTVLDLVPVDATKEQTTQDNVSSHFSIDRTMANADEAALVNSADQLASGRGLIGYLGLDYAFNTQQYPNLQVLAVLNTTTGDFVAPSPSGDTFSTYPLARYLHMVTRLPQYDLTYRLYALDYVYYMLGADGQNIVAGEKYIKIVPGANPAPYWDIVNTDGKNKCNISDAIRIGNHWQQHLAYKGQIPEDVNGDGVVNISDAVSLGINWQKTWNW